jgi:hypothetical protein
MARLGGWRPPDAGFQPTRPARRLFIGSTAARILRVLHVPIVATPGEEVDGGAYVA